LDVEINGLLQQEPEVLPVFGEIAQALANGLSRLGDLDGLTVDLDLPRSSRVRSDDRARYFGASGSHEAGEAQDLTAVEVEGDVLQHVPGAQSRYFERHVLPRDLSSRGASTGVDMTPHHHFDDGGNVDLLAFQGADVSTIAQDRDAVGEPAQFFH